MDKIKVGQVLYKKQTTNRGVFTGTILSVKVTKIGKKYLYCDNRDNDKYDIETFKYQTEYSHFPRQLYRTEQEIRDEEEIEVLTKNIRKSFDYSSRINLTLDQLRLIHNIINEQK